MIQELTKSTDVEALEESYVKRFSHMPKVTLQFFFAKTVEKFCRKKYCTGRPEFLLPIPQRAGGEVPRKSPSGEAPQYGSPVSPMLITSANHQCQSPASDEAPQCGM